MEPHSPAPVNLRLDADGRLDQDLPCLRCGYNLRGLLPDGRCPECGTAIGRSVHGDMLQFCDPDWVNMLARGMTLIWWGLAMLICLPVALPILCLPASYLGGYALGAFFVFNYAVVAVFLAGAGTWHLTTLDPWWIVSEEDSAARRTSRVLLLPTILLLLANALTSLAGGVTLWILPFTASLLLVAGGTLTVSVLAYAATLAVRQPDLPLARSTKLVACGLVLSALVWGFAQGMRWMGPILATKVPLAMHARLNQVQSFLESPRTIAGFALVVFGLWTLRLVDRYAKLLRAAAQHARETWAAQNQSNRLQPGDAE